MKVLKILSLVVVGVVSLSAHAADRAFDDITCMSVSNDWLAFDSRSDEIEVSSSINAIGGDKTYSNWLLVTNLGLHTRTVQEVARTADLDYGALTDKVVAVNGKEIVFEVSKASSYEPRFKGSVAVVLTPKSKEDKQYYSDAVLSDTGSVIVGACKVNNAKAKVAYSELKVKRAND